MTMISINTNYGGIFAAKASSQSQAAVDTAMERLSSGSKINYAKDDAAGVAIATRLTAEIEGLSMASRNAADAQSLIDTAEGGLQETHTLLLRMRELAVQSVNDTMTDADRDHTDAEFKQLQAEIDRISANTTFAGQKLLDGSVASFKFQIGEGSGQTLTVAISDMDSTALVVSSSQEELQSQAAATTAIAAIDTAIETVSTQRASLGAYSNRLGSTMSNLDQINVNLSASKGRIADADFAAETGNLAKNQILQQAATAMIAQANASKSSILALVRG
jgi:flagellin